MIKFKNADMLEMANRRVKRSETWDSRVLVEHHMGPSNVQGYFGVIYSLHRCFF